MAEAIRLHVRYEVPDETGETRRERNERFGQLDQTPTIDIPKSGAHLWEWYFDLSRRLRRTRDSGVEPIPPTEFAAWVTNTGNVVYPTEYAILGKMDAAFCDEMGKEIQAYHERMKGETEQTE